ncbi:MAG: hypothetical protein WB630_12920 [Candidatus Acidiferrales bacterium]
MIPSATQGKTRYLHDQRGLIQLLATALQYDASFLAMAQVTLIGQAR